MVGGLHPNKGSVYIVPCIFILILLISFLLEPKLAFIFETESRIVIHILLELFGIIVSFSIFLYGWNVHPHIPLSTYRWLPFLFLCIGMMDLFHTITYPGMPTFITESSLFKTLWFNVIARLIETIGILLLIIFMFKEQKNQVRGRKWISFFSVMLIFISTVFIFKFESLMVSVFQVDGIEVIKGIYYVLCCMHAYSIIYLLKNVKFMKDVSYMYLLFAVFCLFLRSFLSTVLNNYEDYFSFISHLLKVLGYGYIFMSFYSSKIKMTFIQKEETEGTLKKTEELLRKSEKLAVVGELAAGVSHEIRNPLTTLKGFTQLLGKEVDQSRLPIIEIMSNELDRIERITHEFMVLAKPQAVDYKVKKLQDILEQVLRVLESQANLNNIQIDKMYKVNNVSVYCDENQLIQLFINIIKNAFEAMPNGGKLTVVLKEKDQRHICVSIKDTGGGIPKDIIPKLGEPFYTLKEKGTGLGLMVSYRILEAHKGKIEFQSELNKGTIVDVTLPFSENTEEKRKHCN